MAVLLLFALPLFAAPPAWYLSLPHAPYERIGYGQHPVLESARDLAYADIAAQRGITVESERMQRFEAVDDVLMESYESTTRSRVKARLEGAGLLREACAQGRCYVAVRYDTRPFAGRLASKLGAFAPHRAVSFLDASPLMRGVADQLGSLPACMLQGASEGYRMQCANTALRLRRDEVAQLFYGAQKGALSLRSDKTRYEPGDTLRFLLQTRKKRGYASLYVVEESGKTALFEADIPISGRTLWPNDDTELTLVNDQPRTVRELYIALFSDRPIGSATELSTIGDQRLDEGDYRLHRLLPLLARYDYASVVVTIQKND